MTFDHHPRATPLAAATALTGLFALVHGYWAGGGRVGVPPGTGDIAGRTWFLTYDLLSAAVLLGATVAGAVLTVGGGGRRLRRLAVLGGGLALLRGGVGLAQDVATVLTGRSPGVGTLYDTWFVGVGLLALAGLLGVSAVAPRAARG